MNVYTTTFIAKCPANDTRVTYRLRLESRSMIRVETISAEVHAIAEGFHEDIADRLLAALGGVQTLTADHHGVTIETTRCK